MQALNHLLAFFQEGLLDGAMHYAVAGVVAAVGSYGATRYALGKLVAQVENHGERLIVLEDDAKRCESERGYIRGKLDI